MTQWLQQACNQRFLSIQEASWSAVDETTWQVRPESYPISPLSWLTGSLQRSGGSVKVTLLFEWTWVCCQAWMSNIKASAPTLPQLRWWLGRYLSFTPLSLAKWSDQGLLGNPSWIPRNKQNKQVNFLSNGGGDSFTSEGSSRLSIWVFDRHFFSFLESGAQKRLGFI